MRNIQQESTYMGLQQLRQILEKNVKYNKRISKKASLGCFFVCYPLISSVVTFTAKSFNSL